MKQQLQACWSNKPILVTTARDNYYVKWELVKLDKMNVSGEGGVQGPSGHSNIINCYYISAGQAIKSINILLILFKIQ